MGKTIQYNETSLATNGKLRESLYKQVMKSDQAFCLGPEGEHCIHSLDLHDKASRGQNIALYYEVCRQLAGLLATTSCFSIWKQHNKTNGYAKVIPAVRRSTQSSDR